MQNQRAKANYPSKRKKSGKKNEKKRERKKKRNTKIKEGEVFSSLRR